MAPLLEYKMILPQRNSANLKLKSHWILLPHKQKVPLKWPKLTFGRKKSHSKLPKAQPIRLMPNMSSEKMSLRSAKRKPMRVSVLLKTTLPRHKTISSRRRMLLMPLPRSTTQHRLFWKMPKPFKRHRKKPSDSKTPSLLSSLLLNRPKEKLKSSLTKKKL